MKNIKIFFLCLLLAPVFAFAENMSVQVKAGQVRSKPSFAGKVIYNASYGEQVNILKKQGAWYEITSQGKQGWLHQSALSAKSFKPSAGKGVGSAASGEELSLAGKGFNSAVESEFKSRHRDISFQWIDYMEKITVQPAEMQAFLKQGKVKAPLGGGL